MFCLPSSYTQLSVRDSYISSIGLPILLQENMWTDPGIIYNKSLTDTQDVEIGTEAAQFPEKEYINGIFVAVRIYIECLPMPACLGRPGPYLLVGDANVQKHFVHVCPVRNDLHRVRTLDNPAEVKRK